MSSERINDVTISQAIIDTYNRNLLSDTELDVAVVGGGPAGLIAAHDLAKRGRKVAIFERKLSPGGGMWGGGIGYNILVVQEEGRKILDEFGIRHKEYAPGHYTANSVETTAALIHSACRAGASLYNLLSVEDVMISDNRISGVVIIWSAIEIAGLHVDPISVSAKFVLEATGHPLEVIRKVVKKCDLKLATPSGGIEGERSMNAELGERVLLDNTIEVAPGLYVAGMAANAVMGSFRMGPIFGGMLLSGRKAAEEMDMRLASGAA
jgi:thiamine thiazole synthase